MKWPDRNTVVDALRSWTDDIQKKREDIVRIGYFGSYARGDWGVGSDCDIVVILEKSELPFENRAKEFPNESIPVPLDILIYTRKEWERMRATNSLFYRTLSREACWIISGEGATIPSV